MNQPCFVFWKINKNIKHNKSMFERWEAYGNLVYSQSQCKYPGISVLDFSSQSKVAELNQISSHLILIRLPLPYKFPISFIKSLIFLKQTVGFQPVTLMIGEPIYSPVATLLISSIFQKEKRIQAQVHGEVRLSGSIKFFPKFLLFKIIQYITFFFVQSVRFVSGHLLSKYKKFPLTKKYCFVAPIPIDLQKVATKVIDGQSLICVIGRLHQERNVRECLEILINVTTEYPDAKVNFIGDGPLRGYLLKRVAELRLSDKIVSLGNISSNLELQSIYSKMKILLSCAATEGYGLSIREAALSGAYVVARESEGTISAEREFPKSISTFKNASEGIEKITEILEKPKPKLNLQELRKNQAQKNHAAMITLVQSWI